jgi:UDP-glucose 4-epimerase
MNADAGAGAADAAGAAGGGRMRVLVTGGAGFIGSHLVRALLARGDEVRILDNFSTGDRDNLPAGGDWVLVEGDVRSDATVREAVDGADLVFHLAALPSVPRSIRDPITTNDVNVVGTLNVLNASREARVRRVVYTSSSSVYGQTPDLPKRETLPPRPISPYAVSKLAGEHYCRAYSDLYGLETVVLRLFNVFGPGQRPDSEYAAVVPRFIEQARQGRRPTIFGDGTQTRDFTYVTNVVDAALAAGGMPGLAGRLFNVAAGRPAAVRDVLAMIAGLVGRPAEPVYEPARRGEVLHSHACIDAAREAIGYAPAVDLLEGLRRTVAATAGR